MVFYCYLLRGADNLYKKLRKTYIMKISYNFSFLYIAILQPAGDFYNEIIFFFTMNINIRLMCRKVYLIAK